MPRTLYCSLFALFAIVGVACSPGTAQLENDVRDLDQKVQSLENRVRRIESVASKVGKGMKGKAGKGKAGKGKAGKGKAKAPGGGTDEAPL